MSNSLPIRRAVSLPLASLEGSVLSDYGFGLRLFRLLVGEDPAGLRVAFRGEPVPAKRHYVAALSFARDYGLLSPVQGVPPDRGFLLLVGRLKIRRQRIAHSTLSAKCPTLAPWHCTALRTVGHSYCFCLRLRPPNGAGWQPSVWRAI